MIWHRVSLILAAVMCLSTNVGAGDTQTELVPEANAFLKLGERVRLYLLADLTYAPRSWSANGTESVQELELGPHLDVTLKPIGRRRLRTSNWERERYLWARFGYNYVTALGETGEASHENRAILEATWRVTLPGALWAVNRARVDFRDKNGKHSDRYGNNG